MLTIEHVDCQEEIAIGDLFDQIGFHKSSQPSDDSGDSYVSSEWGIEVLSADTFYPIEGFRWTRPEQQVRLFHKAATIDTLEDCTPYLQCSPDHIVMRYAPDPGWTKVKDLRPNDLIICKNGSRKVVKIQKIDDVDRLCDLQVSIAHSYFAEGVLSHNSHFLVQLGANAMRQGKNVLHYTFELSETLVGMRYDSNLVDVSFNDLHERKQDIIDHYNKAKLGRLVIKEYPMNTATVYTLRSHVEKLALKGFIPDLIIIDYADVMRSTRQYDSLRHELKLIYEELRSYATEIQLPVWTASQANRDSSQNDVVGLESMSEAYGKAMVADVVVSISRKATEKSTGWGRLFIAKNRAGRDGLVYPVRIDTAKSVFTIAGEVTNPDDVAKENEAFTRRTIREKLKELSEEGTIKLSDVTPSREASPVEPE
jgi:hypothetical protein